MDIIFVDIETTGIDRQKCGILSIGACTKKGQDYFYQDCIPNEGSLIDDKALKVNGKTREFIFNNPLACTEKEAVSRFMDWCYRQFVNPILAGYNFNQFDALFLHKAYDGTFNMTWPLGRRFIDIHSIAYFSFGSSLSSDQLSTYLDIKPEERPHDALNGAIQARLIYNKLEKNAFNHD